MAYKTLIFGVDDIFNALKPYYILEIQRGNLDIVAHAVIENDEIRCFSPDGKLKNETVECDIVIVSSKYDLYRRIRKLESMGVPSSRIIDGKVFRVPHLDFRSLVEESIAYGVFENKAHVTTEHSIYRSVYKIKNASTSVKLGRQSFVASCSIEGDGEISVGDFSSLAWNILLELGLNKTHNLNNVT